MTALIEEDKARARRFRDLLVDILDPLLLDGHLREGWAHRPAVEALITLYMHGGPQVHVWGKGHPLRATHVGIGTWQDTTWQGIRGLGAEFADQKQWQPNDMHSYIYIGEQRNPDSGIDHRVRIVRQQLQQGWTL
ncbi:hypothetical protein DWU98_09440 [Dyella monticola]|uniref:Uncharacterized protein n=1 Tax=Dyella monticola TaxID=1927958 RepID=A0A370X1V3_9GAMM|nr:hypothetical protein [Dyella monticola]RDS82247.1 hypothetical protein DWU98_09440 [Dyella monticola]